MVVRFTTIGHSNRRLDEFLAMLRGAQVDIVIDVRSFPRSRLISIACQAISSKPRLTIGTAPRSEDVGVSSRASRKNSTQCGGCRAFTIMPIMR